MKTNRLPLFPSLSPSASRKLNLKRELEELSLVIEWHKETKGFVPAPIQERFDGMKKELATLA